MAVRSFTVSGSLMALDVHDCPNCGRPTNATVIAGDSIDFGCCGRRYTCVEAIDQNGDRTLRLAVAADASTYHVDNPRAFRRREAIEELKRRLNSGRGLRIEWNTPIPITMYGDPYTIERRRNAEGPVPQATHGATTVTVIEATGEGERDVLIVSDGNDPRIDPDRRPCRWCAGDGLNAMLSNRVRILFTEAMQLYGGDIPRDNLGGSRWMADEMAQATVTDLRVIPGVSPGLPLDEWVKRVEEQARAPWPAGKCKWDVACQRCGGSGNENDKQEVTHARPT